MMAELVKFWLESIQRWVRLVRTTQPHIEGTLASESLLVGPTAYGPWRHASPDEFEAFRQYCLTTKGLNVRARPKETDG